MSWNGKSRVQACEHAIWQRTLRAETQRAAAAHGLTFEELWSEVQTFLAMSPPERLAALDELKDARPAEDYHRFRADLLRS